MPLEIGALEDASPKEETAAEKADENEDELEFTYEAEQSSVTPILPQTESDSETEGDAGKREDEPTEAEKSEKEAGKEKEK